MFRFTRLPFGFSSAPGIFQSVTDLFVAPARIKTPENDLGEAVAVYLHDICVAGTAFPEMLQKLIAMFN